MTIASLLSSIETDLEALTGIRQAHGPQDVLNSFPEFVVMCNSGEWTYDIPGNMIGYHNIQIDLYVVRVDATRAYNQIASYLESVPNALLKATTQVAADEFDANAFSLDPPISYRVDPVKIKDVDLARCRWTMRIHTRANLT